MERTVMWLLFSLRVLWRASAIWFLIGLICGYHLGTARSATITIQSGQSAPQGKRDEAPSLMVNQVSRPMMGSTTFVFGQAEASRWNAMDGLSVFPTTDYAVVYDGKAATPEASTWMMIVMGGLLISARLMKRPWAVAKGQRV